MADIEQLDTILKNIVDSVKQSQEQIMDISRQVKEDLDELEQQLADVQYELILVIRDVDNLERLVKQSRKRLAEVSRNFKDYDEADIKAAYDKASEYQLQLALKRQREKELTIQRQNLERRIRRVKNTLEKADRIISQVSAALSLLTGDLNDITDQLEDVHIRELISSKVILAQEQERQRLARDIHDGPAQSMSNLLLKAELCDRLLDMDSRIAHNELNELKSMLRSSLREIRKVIFDLHPMSLDDLGLIPTLKQYIEDFEKESNIAVSMEIIGNPNVPLKSVVEGTVFRIIQEALNNVKKHSKAKYGVITLEFCDDMLNLKISDDGIGFDVQSVWTADGGIPNRGFGLHSMRQRVVLLNGRFSIWSQPGKGTAVLVSIPIERSVKNYGKDSRNDS